MYIRTYVPYCMYHLSIFMFHAYSGILLVCILLSTLKGTKGPFIFIKVKKIPPNILHWTYQSRRDITIWLTAAPSLDQYNRSSF